MNTGQESELRLDDRIRDNHLINSLGAAMAELPVPDSPHGTEYHLSARGGNTRMGRMDMVIQTLAKSFHLNRCVIPLVFRLHCTFLGLTDL